VIEEPAAEPVVEHEPDTRVTEGNWFAIVREVVAQLKMEDRSRVTVGDVELVPPRACATCGCTWEWEDGWCADCHASVAQGMMVESHEQDVRRLRVTVQGEADVSELLISQWASGIHAGLSSRAAIPELRHPVVIIRDHGFVLLDHGPFSRVPELSALVLQALTSALRGERGGKHAAGR